MINVVALQGRLTYPPEIKSTKTGKSVTNFQIAVDRNYKEKQADFIDCVAWDSRAEFIHRYFNKGDMIAIEGWISSDTYTDKNGSSRKKIVVVVNNASFCGSKKETQPNLSVNREESTFEELDDDGNLPF